MKYKITIEYNGWGFVGWQEQEGLRTIQSTIQQAIFSFSGETVVVHAAGRTDAGVHATGQVAHFELQKQTSPDEICGALNHFLRTEGIAVLSAEQVPHEFHARFCAKSRSYFYRIKNRRAHLTLDYRLAWMVPEKLDIDLMNEGAKYLIGKHNFESFRSTQCQANSPLRSIKSIVASRDGDDIRIDISAQSFLHNQVRIIVGTLRKIGNGCWKPSRVAEILETKNRSAAGETAPPYGLYLSKVEY